MEICSQTTEGAELVSHTLHPDMQMTHTLSQAQDPTDSPPSIIQASLREESGLEVTGLLGCVACLPIDRDACSKMDNPDWTFCVLEMTNP